MTENPSRHFETDSPVVVKVGGSLILQIPSIIPVLRASPRPLLIVPGGGPFADAVRKSQASNDAAHWMAIAAMDQYGWIIAQNGLKTTGMVAIPEQTSVFLPYCSMRRYDPLPHTWDVTSDTIAAWVAKSLGIPLLVLKSVDGIMKDDVLQEQITGPLESESVDPFFISFVIDNRIPVLVMNGMHCHRLEQFLAGKPVLGTHIGTTF